MTRSARRPAGRDAGGVTVEEIGGGFLLRPADEPLGEQAELVRALPPAGGVVVVVAVGDDRAEAVWPRLGEVLTRVRDGSRPVVLAMSGAAGARAGRAPLARRIADTWRLTVVAPAGDVVLVPGGMMFAHATADDPAPGWWSFAPDAEPLPLGPRWPAPRWQAALTHLATVADGPVLRPVPAGILVQPPGVLPPGPGDLAYAIAPAGDRPSILVAADVTAAELVAALSGPAARPEWRVLPLYLVPAGAGDLLPLGRLVAGELGVEVEVLTGPRVGLAAAEAPAGERVVLLDRAGRPAWWPFVSSVLCRPPGGPPGPLGWRPPVAGMDVADAAHGVLRLSGSWHVAVTRAGLWAYPSDADPERFPGRLAAAWPVAADEVRIDVGGFDRTIDDEVWRPLDDLLGALPPAPLARLRLAVHGPVTATGDQAARDLAARHDAVLDVEPAPPW